LGINAIGQQTSLRALHGLGQDLLEGSIIPLVPEDRQSRVGTIQHVINITARGRSRGRPMRIYLPNPLLSSIRFLTPFQPSQSVIVLRLAWEPDGLSTRIPVNLVIRERVSFVDARRLVSGQPASFVGVQLVDDVTPLQSIIRIENELECSIPKIRV
jgi:hypothetical protein